MPAHVYRGDPTAIRYATAHAIQFGSFSIPYQRRGTLAGATESRGQYFYENDQKQLLYSKYRVAASALALPPLALNHLVAPAGDSVEVSPLLALNLYNVLLSMVTGLYLLAWARRLSPRPAPAWALAGVIVALYTGYVWYYLRAQSPEIFQIMLFSAATYHVARMAEAPSLLRHVMAATGCVIALGLLKPYYILLFGPLLGAAWLVPGHQEFKRNLAVLIGGGLTLLALLLAENLVMTGHALDFGYSQWKRGGVPVASFSLANFPTALAGFLLGGDRSIWGHMPMMVLGVVGGVLAASSRPAATFFVWGSLALVVLCVSGFANWRGDWCYGPRFWVFAAPAASLMGLSVMERLQRGRFRSLFLGCAACATSAAIFSLYLQLQVNRLEFHANYCAKDPFLSLNHPQLNAYFQINEAFVFTDIQAFAEEKSTFPALEIVRRYRLGTPRGFRRRELLVRGCHRMNYFLFR